MNMIESVVYCAAGLMLLSFGTPHKYEPHQKLSLNNINAYVSLTFLVLPSLMLIVIFIIKIFTCLCCIRRRRLAEGLHKVFKCLSRDSDAMLPQALPDRLEHPQDYEPLN